MFRKFSSRQQSTCCVQISWNLADGKSVKSCIAYLTKKSPGSPAVATAWIAPKICQGQPPTMYSEFCKSHPNQFTFGGVIAERVNTAKTRRKVNPIFGKSLALSHIMKVNAENLKSVGLMFSRCTRFALNIRTADSSSAWTNEILRALVWISRKGRSCSTFANGYSTWHVWLHTLYSIIASRNFSFCLYDMRNSRSLVSCLFGKKDSRWACKDRTASSASVHFSTYDVGFRIPGYEFEPVKHSPPSWMQDHVYRNDSRTAAPSWCAVTVAAAQMLPPTAITGQYLRQSLASSGRGQIEF